MDEVQERHARAVIEHDFLKKKKPLPSLVILQSELHTNWYNLRDHWLKGQMLLIRAYGGREWLARRYQAIFEYAVTLDEEFLRWEGPDDEEDKAQQAAYLMVACEYWRRVNEDLPFPWGSYEFDDNELAALLSQYERPKQLSMF